MKNVIVSACLIGCKCTYKNSSNLIPELLDYFKMKNEDQLELSDSDSDNNNSISEADNFILIPVCPEQLGGLSTPRTPSELQNKAADIIAGRGKVLAHDGVDVTSQFIKGGKEALRLARMYQAKSAILKQKSPSCGSLEVHDGSATGTIIDGRGITAELFVREGIRIFDEDNWKEAFQFRESNYCGIEI